MSPAVFRAESRGETLLVRIISGLSAMFRILRELKKVMRQGHYDILHTTTSGDIGSLRDYFVAKRCRHYGVKTIMHCRYGCVTENILALGLIGWLTRKSMRAFDQIWVLDSRSYNTLRGVVYLKDKVYLVPNSIDVTEDIDLAPKDYRRVAFIGNLYTTKGLYELVEACIRAV